MNKAKAMSGGRPAGTRNGETREIVRAAVLASPWLSDEDVGKTLGLSQQTVSTHRRACGLPSLQDRKRAAVDAALLANPFASYEDVIGACIPLCDEVSASMVYLRRKALGLANGQGDTRERVRAAVLAHPWLSDEDLGATLGLAQQAVSAHRRACRLPSLQARKRAAVDAAILADPAASYEDVIEACVPLCGEVSASMVQRRRKALGLPKGPGGKTLD